MSTEEVQEEIPAQPVAKYVEQLRSSNREQREQAVAELKKIGPDGILDLLLEVERKDKRRVQEWLKRTNSRNYAWLAIFFMCMGVVMLCCWSRMQAEWAMYIPVLTLGISLVTLSFSTHTNKIIREIFRRSKILALLRESQNPRVVGALCESLRVPHDQLNHRAYAALRSQLVEPLIRLLPRVRPDQPDLPDAKQRALLRLTLERRSRTRYLPEYEIRLVRALLQFMMHMGDLQALPAVERLASRRGALPQEEEMIAQAKVCLQALQDLQQRSHLSEALLRGSEAPVSLSNELLRGVTESNQNEEKELLRAGISEKVE